MKTISIGGKEYPMNFSLRAAAAMSERYGGLDHIMDAFSDGARVAGELPWMIALLVGQGVARKNLLEGTNDRAPTEEEVGVLLDVAELAQLQGSVMGAMAGDTERTVETEPEDEGKNAGAAGDKGSSRGASSKV